MILFIQRYKGELYTTNSAVDTIEAEQEATSSAILVKIGRFSHGVVMCKWVFKITSFLNYKPTFDQQ